MLFHSFRPVKDSRSWMPYSITAIVMVECESMSKDRKITVHVPEELLEKAREQTGEGITATVRQGLRLVAASHAYSRLRELRGEVPIEVDLEALREDRS